jgi:hypothetical protein
MGERDGSPDRWSTRRGGRPKSQHARAQSAHGLLCLASTILAHISSHNAYIDDRVLCLQPYTATHQNYKRRKKLENRGHPIGSER